MYTFGRRVAPTAATQLEHRNGNMEDRTTQQYSMHALLEREQRLADYLAAHPGVPVADAKKAFAREWTHELKKRRRVAAASQ